MLRSVDPVWYGPIGFAALFVACLLMGLFGADSRPHFSTGKLFPKERWFVHKRRD